MNFCKRLRVSLLLIIGMLICIGITTKLKSYAYDEKEYIIVANDISELNKELEKYNVDKLEDSYTYLEDNNMAIVSLSEYENRKIAGEFKTTIVGGKETVTSVLGTEVKLINLGADKSLVEAAKKAGLITETQYAAASDPDKIKGLAHQIRLEHPQMMNKVNSNIQKQHDAEMGIEA